MRKQLAFPGQTQHRKLGQFVNLRIVEKITEDGADVRYVIRTDDKRICLRNDGHVFDTSGKHIGNIIISPEEFQKLSDAFNLNNGMASSPGFVLRRRCHQLFKGTDMDITDMPVERIVKTINESVKKSLSGFVGRKPDLEQVREAVTRAIQGVLPDLQFNFVVQNDVIVAGDARTAFTVALMQMGLDAIRIRYLISTLQDGDNTLNVPEIGQFTWDSNDKGKMGFQPNRPCEFIELKLVV